MPGDVYTQRMNELEGKKAEKVINMFPDLKRPSPINSADAGIGANLKPDQPDQPIQPDMNSFFGQLMEKYKGQDSRFDQLTSDYASLVSGLKQQVDAGMMPEVIAKQRMKQFLTDGRGYFKNNKAKPMDDPKIKGVLEGMLQGEMELQGGGPQGAPMPQGQAPAPQGMMPQGGM